MHDKSSADIGKGFVNIKVDDKPYVVPKGINLIDALIGIGKDISYFCYHPRLSVAAKCRQCLVAIGDSVKLSAACEISTEEGLSVHSETERVRQARQAQLSLTLLNHPVDCVICDKAGECSLQRQYMNWDGQPSKLAHEKVKKPKRVEIGPDIILDAERCILCGRCARFVDEVVGESQLLFAERGNHTVLCCAPGEKLDNPYSLNTVDICPVGALTDKKFRFRSRIWNLRATSSACQYCSAACDIEIHSKGNEVCRVVPRKRLDFNENWICNYGRRACEGVTERDRIENVLLDRSEATEPEALDRVAQLLEPHLTSGGTRVAFLLGASATNEDIWAAVRLIQEFFPHAHRFICGKKSEEQGDLILRRSDPNPNRRGVIQISSFEMEGDQTLQEASALFQLCEENELDIIVALEFRGELPSSASANFAKHRIAVLSLCSEPSDLTREAQIVLPSPIWVNNEGTVTNFAGKVKKLHHVFKPAQGIRPCWDWLQMIARRLGTKQQSLDAKELYFEMARHIHGFSEDGWPQGPASWRLRFENRRG